MDHSSDIKHLNDQHPRTWTPGHWYPATTKAGIPMEIKRTTAVKTGVPYLHIRKRGIVNLKTPSGEIIDRREQWFYYRANLNTFELKEI